MRAKAAEPLAAERVDPAERRLAVALRLGGSLLLLAFGAVLLPTQSMTATHRWLTMGEFPESPLADYLTRSISLLYGIKGGMYWVLATDVRRYAPVIRYVGWTTIGFGVLMVAIDYRAGMPLFWTLSEGPPIAAIGMLFLLLLRRVDAVGRA
ncbi:MAG TPA: hypothetical protein VD788_03645 [Candidatus Polarisedimenticolaceae bacterium]|nr:hypothetical protein [Candidatus Polarisedimenticolaceae bacterium]